MFKSQSLDKISGTSLQKASSFEFFKKQESKESTKKVWSVCMNRFWLMPSILIAAPAIFYKLTKVAPELKASLPVLLDSISASTYCGLAGMVYGVLMALWLIKDSLQNIKNSEKTLGENSSNVFIPIFFAIEASFIFEGLAPIWSVLWPIIR